MEKIVWSEIWNYLRGIFTILFHSECGMVIKRFRKPIIYILVLLIHTVFSVARYKQLRILQKHQLMKNPLLTHISLRPSKGFMKLTLSILWVTFLFLSHIAAQPLAPVKTECQCLNNASSTSDGQYLDNFTFTSNPDEDWRIVSPIGGFYHPASLPPPATPILYLPNTKIPETSPGVYRIEGKRLSGQSWTVDVLNTATGYRTTVTSVQNCWYPMHNVSETMPASVIEGDSYVCPSATGIMYNLNNNGAAITYSELSWNLADGGSIASPINVNPIAINWGPTSGRYGMSVSGVAFNFAGQSEGCNFTVSRFADVVDTSPFTTIIGDFGNCIGDTESYTINATASQINPAVTSWGVFTDPEATIPAMGVGIMGTLNHVTVTWPYSTGVYYLAVRGQFRINNDADYCDFEDIRRIDIVNESLVSMACNNVVNISMNPSCELTFDPDQFLEDAFYPKSSYDIIIRDIQADTIVPNGTLGFGYVGKTLEIKVIHECSGNSCWSFAVIEDKSIPELICPDDTTIECTQLDNILVTGFPILDPWITVIPSETDNTSWTLLGFDRCSDVFLTYTDDADTDLCDGPYSSVITRTWTVTDQSANSSYCTHTIYVLRADIEDVIFPSHWDDISGPNPSLEACDEWPVLPEGHPFAGNPDPSFTGYPLGTLCLKSSVTFTDRKIPLCDGNPLTYKLIRRWVVLDHCTSEKREENQLITVMDTEAPIITCPADLTTQNGQIINPAEVIYTQPNTCTGNWSVLPPSVFFECSAVTWDVDFLLADASGNPPVDGFYTKIDDQVRVVGSRPAFSQMISETSRPFRIENLPIGRTWIRYTVMDLCGNETYCFTVVDVQDNIPPTPVCDQNSIVAIGTGGVAWAGPLTFDDKSHDNCGVTCFKVRRTDSGPSGWSQQDWDVLECNNRVRFTCEDVGKSIMVELYVQDAAGAWNTCMVEAAVQDNIPPTIVAPPDVTAHCYEDFVSLTKYGAAEATDNCEYRVIEKREDLIGECGTGTIVRTFTATDTYGNISTDTQIITIGNNSPFNGNTDVTWPQDVTLTNVCLADISPDNLPSNARRPVPFRNLDCAEVLTSYEDVVFPFGEDNVCIKVLRTWTVKDWCQGSAYSQIGVWQRTQLIMINNTNAPVILAGCSSNDLIVNHIDECRAQVRLGAAAQDDCTPNNLLIWSYSIDENNDGTLEVTQAAGNVMERILPYGTHSVIWSVRDQCDNVRTCTNTFTLEDTKKPTPYCISDLVTVIMPSSGDVAIWASDFDLGATDNCSTGSDITASFSATDRMDISRSFTCEMLEGQPFRDFTLDVYAIDAAGNSDFCTVNLRVQDNNDSCGDEEDNGNKNIILKGAVYSEQDDRVEGVDVQIMAVMPEFPKSMKTFTDGAYVFEALQKEADYTLSPYKNDDILNGITTLDLVLIQRHILGVQVLNSPYKVIAADINNSQRVTAADLVELRKVILGISNEFTDNTSWRFVDAQHNFVNRNNPFPYTESIFMDHVEKDYADLDFVAVKIGDVNGSAKANSVSSLQTDTRNALRWWTSAITASKGDIVDVKVRADEVNNLLGMQMTWLFDASKAQLVDIHSSSLDMTEDHMGFTQLADGKIHMSWHQSSPVRVQDEVMTFTFRILEDLNEQPLVSIAHDGLSPEIYTLESDEVLSHSLRIQTDVKGKSAADKFEVYQNLPNPFNTTTVIGFNLPQSSMVTLKVIDATGKLVHQTQNYFGKGYNSFELDGQALNLSGVMYYKIDTEYDSETRKMIIIR